VTAPEHGAERGQVGQDAFRELASVVSELSSLVAILMAGTMDDSPLAQATRGEVFNMGQHALDQKKRADALVADPTPTPGQEEGRRDGRRE
jgi:hypothetical protein